jgi:mono/diheme cytochrome c family protein
MNPLKYLVAFVIGSLGCICAAQQVEIKKVPITYVSPAAGDKMYATYCAVCHGTQGQGNGPAKDALKTPPTDLTLLARMNGGKYPEAHIYQVIVGDSLNPAHGDKDMPVWGNLFSSLSGASPAARAEVHQRVSVLNKYIESLQK